MIRRERFAAILAITLAGCAGAGCSLRKAKGTPPQVVLPPPTASEPEKPDPLPAPPKVEPKPQVATLPGPPNDSSVEAPKPEAPKPPPRSSRASSTPEPPQQPAETPVESVPALVPLLSAAEQERYNRDIDELLQRAEADLAKVGKRSLDDRQKLDVGRARGFILQVHELRRTDLVGAKNIAQRAALLADSVVRSLR